MCALAHAIEAEGIATVALASVWGQVQRSHPPRALFCEFPLGRPLGRPNDPELHHRVLAAAFELLDREEGPVLDRFDEVITDGSAQPDVCPLPPRSDADVPAALDELLALRPAWERARAANGGRTSLQHVGVDGLDKVVSAMLAVVDDGTPWKEAGMPAHPHDAMVDLRGFYEEAAVALAEHVPAARQAEAWFFERTEAGALVLKFRQALQDQGAGFATWFYTTPFNR